MGWFSNGGSCFRQMRVFVDLCTCVFVLASDTAINYVFVYLCYTAIGLCICVFVDCVWIGAGHCQDTLCDLTFTKDVICHILG